MVQLAGNCVRSFLLFRHHPQVWNAFPKEAHLDLSLRIRVIIFRWDFILGRLMQKFLNCF